MDDVLFAIKNDLPDLKTLKIALTGVTASAFSQCVPTLKKLTELHINAGTACWLFRAADEMSFPNIETLFLNVNLLVLHQKEFQNLFGKFPKVETLHIVTNFTEIISVIFKNRLHMQVRKCTVDFTNVHGIFTHSFSPKLCHRDHLLKDLNISNTGIFLNQVQSLMSIYANRV